jgi:hypothetical protein
LCDQPTRGIHLAQVGWQGDGASPQGLDLRHHVARGVGRRRVMHGHIRARPRQAEADSAAEAVRATRDESDLTE